MSWWKDTVKSAKKTVKHWGEEIGDELKAGTRAVAKGVQYGAPILGTALAGPLGGGLGTLIGAGAAQVGPTKNAAAQFKRSLMYGGAVTAAGVGIGLASGAGGGAPLLSSLGKLFGFGGTPSPAPAASKGVAGEASKMQRNLWGIPVGNLPVQNGQQAPSSSNPGLLETIATTAIGALFPPQGTGKDGGPSNDQWGQYRPGAPGDVFGSGGGVASLVPGGPGGLIILGVLGVGAFLLFRKG